MRSIVATKIRTLLAQQSGHIQLLIFAPILTLFLLSLVVRTANSAIDPTLEKKKVTQQLKQRLIEVRNVDGNPSSQVVQNREEIPTVTKSTEAETSLSLVVKPELPIALVAKDQENAQPAANSSSREFWAVAGIWAEDLLLSYSAGVTTTPNLFTESPAEKKLLANSTKPSIPAQWKTAKSDSISTTLLFPTLNNTPSSKKKEEKSQPGIKVPDIALVKAELEEKIKKKTAKPIDVAALTPVPLPAAPRPETKEDSTIVYPEHLSLPIKKSETFEKVLKRVGVPAKEVGQWIKAAGKYKEFRSLRPGQILELSFSQDVENPGLKTIVYAPEMDLRFILERKTAKLIETSRIQPPAQPVWYVLGGHIEKSFSKSVKKLGLPEKMIEAVLGLEWEGIALSDLDSGDPFKILLEAVQRGRKIIEYKALLAAEVVNQGQTHTAFLLPEEYHIRQSKRLTREYSGVGLDIESEGQKFLRFPLEFSRISSHFSNSRFHPILHRARRHNGIDFAAPRGTPVYSVAKGIVTFVGRQSGYGNIVKIDHPGPYETAYAHLQGFADGIEEGIEIEKGRIVGFVGSTGLATGPHLHFELLKDGIFVNPFHERTDELTIVETEEPEPVDPVIEAKKKFLVEKLTTLEIRGNLLTSMIIPQQREAIADASNGQPQGPQQKASSEESHQR